MTTLYLTGTNTEPCKNVDQNLYPSQNIIFGLPPIEQQFDRYLIGFYIDEAEKYTIQEILDAVTKIHKSYPASEIRIIYAGKLKDQTSSIIFPLENIHFWLRDGSGNVNGYDTFRQYSGLSYQDMLDNLVESPLKTALDELRKLSLQKLKDPVVAYELQMLTVAFYEHIKKSSPQDDLNILANKYFHDCKKILKDQRQFPLSF